jgi:AraC-like DNA-binding protein
MTLFSLSYLNNPGMQVARHGNMALDRRDRFFSSGSGLELHDVPNAFARTDVAQIGNVSIVRVVSTGHGVDVDEPDCLSLMSPLRGRLITSIDENEHVSTFGGVVAMSTGRRRSRVVPDETGAFLGALVRIRPGALAETAAKLDPDLGRRVHAARFGLASDSARWHSGAMLTRYLAVLIEELERAESLLRRPQARLTAANLIAELFVDLLETSGALHAARPESVVSERRIRTAEAFMRDQYSEIVSMTEVAEAAGVSLRALQTAFQRLRGSSPRAALGEIRLLAARERLSNPASAGTVSDVAMDCGFTHLGRFSAAYRDRFGETPSTTLRRALAAA